MKRLGSLAFALILLGTITGCKRNVLIGKWQKADGPSLCDETLTFTSTQQVRNDAEATPSDDVSYEVRDSAVYVTRTPNGTPTNPQQYKIIDNDHMAWVSYGGFQCAYVRAQ